MRKLFKIFTNKIFVTLVFFVIQMALLTVILLTLTAISGWIYFGFTILSLVVCLFILGKDANPGYKLAWVIPILLFPLFGGLMHITFGRSARLRRKERKLIKQIQAETANVYDDQKDASDKILDGMPAGSRKLGELIYSVEGYPVYGGSTVEYYPLGEDFWAALTEQIKKAEKYVFLEYFIIDRGKCWDAVLDALEQKVAEGVDVRLIYDDVGCLFTLPFNYAKKLTSRGIKTHVFNKIKPTLNIRMNNRTHRKIAVIDGKAAFTGGVNLADEYINAKVRFGHWKDTAVKIEGPAVRSFAVMFLQFWQLLEREQFPVKFYLPETQGIEGARGYVQPVASMPDKNNQIIEKGLMSIINNAGRYVYINTPYLVPDNEFVSSLCLAAQSGVDVRITMPHIPDKKTVFMMSRSFYPVLLKAGVKIYEYLPGFVHAKSTVCDDSVAYVGTCNLDYRSFYLHYECGAFMYDLPAIADLKADYLDVLSRCRQISYEEATSVNPFVKLLRAVMRLFAPLM